LKFYKRYGYGHMLFLGMNYLGMDFSARGRVMGAASPTVGPTYGTPSYLSNY